MVTQTAKNLMTLEGKVALVTGAGSGIGAATAKRFAEAGARVGLAARTKEELEAVKEDIEAAGGEALVLTVDISDVDSLQGAYDALLDRWGRLDVVFANAGINGVWAPIEDLTLDEWKKTIDINLTGTFATIKFAVPHLKKQGGAIVVTASVNGTRMFSNSGATAYASTKAAQVAMTKMLALELAKHRVRVNVICPGAIDTQISENTEQRNTDAAREPVEFPEGMIPLTDGEPGTSEEVAELVLFLSSDASKHMTGTEMWIDGGQSLLQG